MGLQSTTYLQAYDSDYQKGASGAQTISSLIYGGAAAILIPGAAEAMLVGSTGLTGYSLGTDINTIFTAERQYGAFMNADGTATSYGEMAFNMLGKGAILGLNFLGASALSAAKTGSVSSLPDPYQGIKDASKYLQEIGVSRAERVNILQSFNPQNISINIANDATYGLRFYNVGTNPTGRYLFPTFTNQTSRSGMAIIPEFNNSMSGIQQFQLKPGSVYLQGTAAPKGIYPGGSQQIFTQQSNLIKL
jgi:hypothetical protein